MRRVDHWGADVADSECTFRAFTLEGEEHDAKMTTVYREQERRATRYSQNKHIQGLIYISSLNLVEWWPRFFTEGQLY